MKMNPVRNNVTFTIFSQYRQAGNELAAEPQGNSKCNGGTFHRSLLKIRRESRRLLVLWWLQLQRIPNALISLSDPHFIQSLALRLSEFMKAFFQDEFNKFSTRLAVFPCA
jgi:hypothetical protein